MGAYDELLPAAVSVDRHDVAAPGSPIRAGRPSRFTLDEARIRSVGPRVQYSISDNTGDPDERTRLRRGALTIARNVIKKSREGTIEIIDGPDVWIIPEGIGAMGEAP